MLVLRCGIGTRLYCMYVKVYKNYAHESTGRQERKKKQYDKRRGNTVMKIEKKNVYTA